MLPAESVAVSVMLGRVSPGVEKRMRGSRDSRREGRAVRLVFIGIFPYRGVALKVDCDGANVSGELENCRVWMRLWGNWGSRFRCCRYAVISGRRGRIAKWRG